MRWEFTEHGATTVRKEGNKEVREKGKEVDSFAAAEGSSDHTRAQGIQRNCQVLGSNRAGWTLGISIKHNRSQCNIC